MRDPLRAPRDARRAADRAAATTRAAIRGGARRASRIDDVRAVVYDGTYEDLFFYVERLIVAGCGAEVAGRLHTARSRNDIDMTMYRMQQRQLILAVIDGVAAAADGAARPGGPSSRGRVRRAHAYAAGAAEHHRALPARRDRAARTRRGASQGRLRQHQPQSARRLRDHRHRAFRSTARAPPSCSGSTRRPATPTAASRRSTTCSKSVSATARAAGRARPRRAGLAALVHDGVRLPAAGGRLRAGQQHHAAEAQPGGARARARDRQQGASARRARSSPPSTTRRSATSSTPRTICSRSCCAMFKDAIAGGRRWSPPRCRRRSSTRERLAERAGQGWITVTELADTLTRDSGVPFTAGHEIADAARVGRRPAASQPPRLARRAPCARCRADVIGRPIALHAGRALAEILSPRHFVEVRTTPGGRRRTETARARALCPRRD